MCFVVVYGLECVSDQICPIVELFFFVVCRGVFPQLAQNRSSFVLMLVVFCRMIGPREQKGQIRRARVHECVTWVDVGGRPGRLRRLVFWVVFVG